MTSDDPHPSPFAEGEYTGGRLLAEVRSTLRRLGLPEDQLEIRRPPIVSGQAQIYVLAQGAHDLYVAKVVGTAALAAAAQYRALAACHAWWGDEDAHSVARPLALLADCDAVLMDYVPGRNVAQVFAAARPGAPTARAAAWAAGDFLRRFHMHGAVAHVDVDLPGLVAEVRASQVACLEPLGLSMPMAVARVLDRIAGGSVVARQVLLHGDYAPRNLIVTGPAEVTMIDPVLVDHGPPEHDIASFLAIMSSASVFMSSVAFPHVRAARVALERAFIDGYGVENISPVICGLRLIHEQIWRWAYRRRRPLQGPERLLSGLRAGLIDVQMAALLEESAATLAEALVGRPDRDASGAVARRPGAPPRSTTP